MHRKVAVVLFGLLVVLMCCPMLWWGFQLAMDLIDTNDVCLRAVVAVMVAVTVWAEIVRRRCPS